MGGRVTIITATEARRGERQPLAVAADTAGVVRESADLLYNLTVLWAALGVRPQDVWYEMKRRENLLGFAEKMPKAGTRPAKRDGDGAGRRIVALDSARLRKHS